MPWVMHPSQILKNLSTNSLLNKDLEREGLVDKFLSVGDKKKSWSRLKALPYRP